VPNSVHIGQRYRVTLEPVEPELKMPDNVTATQPASATPEDLSGKAIKLARRIQALADGIYRITLVKGEFVWSLQVEGEGSKVEVLR